jgi:phosphoglycolate phosphatase
VPRRAGSHAYPGLEDALTTLHMRGARLAVCTNKQASLSDQLLHDLRLRPRFAALAGRDTFPVCKPHPDHLIGAIRMAGGDPRRAIMVGDSKTDIDTAKAAGIPVVAVTFGYTDVHVRELAPDAVIEHYDELIPAIERIMAR